VALSYEDIKPGERALKELSKGNTGRLAYVLAGTLQRLELWADQIRGEALGTLFPRIRQHDVVTENRLTDQAMYHILLVRQLQAGIKKRAPHDFCRTFETPMLDNKEDLSTVKETVTPGPVVKHFDVIEDTRPGHVPGFIYPLPDTLFFE